MRSAIRQEFSALKRDFSEIHMKRDLRLDSIRGLLLAEIALVHTGSAIGLFVAEFFGRVSMAAAFIFLSGLVAGTVYSRTAEKGTQAIWTRSIKRALYVHSYHVCTFLFLLLVIAIIPDTNGYFRLVPQETAINWWETLINVLALTSQPQYLDILPLYTVFILFMPLALLAFQRGYAPVVFAISLALWGLAQFGWGGDRSFGGSYFNPLAWQVLFFTGLYFGDIQLRRGIERVKENRKLVTVCLIICAFGFTLRWNLFDWPAMFDQGTVISSKSNYGIAYLVNFFAFAYLVFCLSKRVPRLFIWRPFAFLGQHSVQVFSFHIIAIYLARPVIWRAMEISWWGHDAISLIIVLSLFIPALLHQNYKSHQTRHRPAKLLHGQPDTLTRRVS